MWVEVCQLKHSWKILMLPCLTLHLLSQCPPPYGLPPVTQKSPEFAGSPAEASCNVRVVSKRTFFGTVSRTAACRNWNKVQQRSKSRRLVGGGFLLIAISDACTEVTPCWSWLASERLSQSEWPGMCVKWWRKTLLLFLTLQTPGLQRLCPVFLPAVTGMLLNLYNFWKHFLCTNLRHVCQKTICWRAEWLSCQLYSKCMVKSMHFEAVNTTKCFLLIENISSGWSKMWEMTKCCN